MSRDTPATRSSSLEVVTQVEVHERLLNRDMQSSFPTEMKPFADNMANMDTQKAVLEEPEPQHPASDSVT